MNTPQPSPNKSFVIGPIGDKDAPDGSTSRIAYEEGIQVFEEVIRPACTGFGLEAVRADMIPTSGEIPEQIFRQLRDSPVVIADLTGANPNVMYELGLRHTTGKVTIQIGEKGRLPFDVAAIRTIMFKRSDAGLVQARKDLSKALAANLDSGGDPVSATRVWFEALTIEQDEPEDEAEGKQGLESETDDAPGFLELLAEMETGIQSLGQTMTGAVSIVQDISTIYTDGVEAVRQADARGGGAGARLVIAEQIAARLGEQASKLEVVSGEYARTVERVEPGLRFVFESLAEDPQQLAEVPNFPNQVGALCAAARGSIQNTLEMKNSVIETGKASRSLKRVGHRLAPAFIRFAETSERVAGWDSMVNALPRVSPPPASPYGDA
jgi:hypothetical protein